MKALLRRWRHRSVQKPLDPAAIAIDGREVPVQFRRHSKARRLIVRLDRSGRGVVVTLPLRASRDEGLAFVHRSADWIAARLDRQGANVAFVHGAEFPLRGRMVRILHQPRQRGTVWFEEETLCLHVSGGVEHINRRIIDWLKGEARRDLMFASETYARAMGVKFRRLSVRDQKSRWGSCTSDGTLSYSWRLIMAPPHVLDYVAAHEVAHLRHMDHSMRFWRLVLSHCHGAGEAKTWLKANSTTLHKYGEKP